MVVPMEKSLILIKSILLTLFLLLNKISYSQSFEFNKDYIEAPLIFSHETILKGISIIKPVGGNFSKYSKIELSKVSTDIIEPNMWLKDKLFSELGEIAKIERLLRSEDSPLSDPVFEQFKHLPMHIDDTLEQLVANPFVFCNDIQKQYNKEGVFFDLNCTVPFGFFNKYLILRLQFEDMMWYFTKITSLNYNRFIDLINIAETFSAKK
jgi:hypothetical protein